MTSRKTTGFILGGLLLALVLAGVVSNFASSSPDGLESATLQGCTTDEEGTITGGECIAQHAKEQSGPLPDYGIPGIDNPYLSTALAGVLGVLATFAVGIGLFWLVARRTRNAVGSNDG